MNALQTYLKLQRAQLYNYAELNEEADRCVLEVMDDAWQELSENQRQQTAKAGEEFEAELELAEHGMIKVTP